MALPIVQPRSCGPCRHCCIDLDVVAEGIAHKKGEPCPKLSADGCSIYDTRPEDPCRDFECLWLRGFADDEHRPDLWGVMLHEMGGHPIFGSTVVATELRPGALADGTDGAKAVLQIGFTVPTVMNFHAGNQRLSSPGLGSFTAEQAAAMMAKMKAKADA